MFGTGPIAQVSDCLADKKVMGDDMSEPTQCPLCGAAMRRESTFGGTMYHQQGEKLCLRRQRDALQAVVDRYPKTADGVPMVPGGEYVRRVHQSGAGAKRQEHYADSSGHSHRGRAVSDHTLPVEPKPAET